jgi:hypothetical protein
MNDPALNFLPVDVLGGSIVTRAALLIGMQRSLKAAGWPDRDRRKAIGSIALLLMVWFFAELIFARLGFFRGTASGIPTIQLGILIPLLAGAILFWRWPLLRRVVDAMPQAWIAGVQFFRVEGAIFLVLYAIGKLPGAFAWPAGYGDITVGLLAPIVGIAYARRGKSAAGWLLMWNVLGLADLAVALTTGFLTSPSRLQMLALDAPNTLIGAFPLVMIPVFLVPLAILLHFASLQKLQHRQETATTRAPRSHTVESKA